MLLLMSIIEPFCAELCAEILGTSTQQMQILLDTLDRSNVPLVSLDERPGWYRFNHLFHALLEQHV